MFKVALQDRWLVVMNTPQLIEEVRKLSDEQANFVDAAHEVDGIPYLAVPLVLLP